jgi:hypothetical protein
MYATGYTVPPLDALLILLFVVWAENKEQQFEMKVESEHVRIFCLANGRY